MFHFKIISLKGRVQPAVRFMNRLLTVLIVCLSVCVSFSAKAQGLQSIYTLPCGANTYTVIPVVNFAAHPPYTLFAADGITVIAGPQNSNIFPNIAGIAGNNFVISVISTFTNQPVYTAITLNSGTTTINGTVNCACTLGASLICNAVPTADSIMGAAYLWTSPTGAIYHQRGFIALTQPPENGIWTVSANFTGGTCNYVLTNSFVLSNCFSPGLPIKLNYFRATGNNCSITAEWSTAIEQNTDQFEIEISENGSTGWIKAATVKAAGNSSSDIVYNTIIDIDNADVKFLRLKEIDLDGHTNYSQVVRVSTGCKPTADRLIIFPGIVQQNGTLTIKLTSSADRGNSYIVVTDISGRQLLKKNIVINKQVNQYNISPGNCSKGVYFIKAVNPLTGWTSNVVKFMIQ
jgi:hypothetical protein